MSRVPIRETLIHSALEPSQSIDKTSAPFFPSEGRVTPAPNLGRVTRVPPKNRLSQRFPWTLSPSRGFSLIEVVFALGIFSFALIAILGLFTTGLKTTKDSEGSLRAANTASLLVARLKAIPTTTNATYLKDLPITSSDLTSAYSPALVEKFIKLDGTETARAADADYKFYYKVGTTPATGSKVAQVYFMLVWPAESRAGNSNAGRYEILTHLALP